MLKKYALTAGAGVVLLVTLMTLRTFGLGAPPSGEVKPLAQVASAYDRTGIADRVSAAIQIRTISLARTAPTNAPAFAAFADLLEASYPAAHAKMHRERVNRHSLLFRWEGSDQTLPPIGFLAHMDVVPVEPGTEDEWAHHPFGGVIADGRVYGRGALDNKGQLIAIMEAVERLAVTGFKPARDVYLFFGHDEEIGGLRGANEIAKLLKSRGVNLSFTLDEGSGVVDGIIPGARGPIALIATAEKGYVNLNMTARADGGHSSTPGRETAVSRAGRAVVTLIDNPHPAELDENVIAFLHGIAPAMPFPMRFALANLWITGPAVSSMLVKSPVTAASLRTTTAPTIINGGVKANILPQTASAVVNYRVHPRDTVEGVKSRAEKLISDPFVTVDLTTGAPASPQSSVTSDGYRAIVTTTADIYGGIASAPSLTLQGTDTKHFVSIANDNYRFTPFIYQKEDLGRIHGTDEFVEIDTLLRAASWYETFIRRTAGPSPRDD